MDNEEKLNDALPEEKHSDREATPESSSPNLEESPTSVEFPTESSGTPAPESEVSEAESSTATPSTNSIESAPEHKPNKVNAFLKYKVGICVMAAILILGVLAVVFIKKYNNEKDDRVRLASYARDLNADVNSLNRVTAAGQVAYNCYSAKFRAALEDYKAKRITRAELDQRYAEIKSGLAEASAILGSTLNEADKREAEYRQVLAIEAKKASRPIPPVQTVATTSKKTKKAAKTVTRRQTGDQLQNLSNGVGSYRESTAQLTAVKSDLDEIQLQMDKVMLAQG